MGLGLFVLVIVFNIVSATLREGKALDYSEFKNQLDQGRLTEVVIGLDTIHGKYPFRPEQSRGAVHGRRRSRTPSSSRSSRRRRSSSPAKSQAVARRGADLGAPDRAHRRPLDVLLPADGRRRGRHHVVRAQPRARSTPKTTSRCSFADVAGVDEAAEELREIVEFLKNPTKYTTLGGRIPKGVLLVGPPGTGKTLLARAVAGEAKVPFFSLSGSEFVEMFVGVGAARVRDLFRQAEAKAPCIVFIDELDALGKVRMQSPMGGHEEREQTLNQLLVEMDGFDSQKGVIIMAATNRPEVLDPALLRPGRFDRQVLVDKPDVKGREAILRIHVKHGEARPRRRSAGRSPRARPGSPAPTSPTSSTRRRCWPRGATRPRSSGATSTRPSTASIAGLEKKRVMNARERRIVAYHESGHAIVATVLPGLDPVHKISIVQRGFGALGYTMQLPPEDRYLMTRTELENQLAVLLGGRTAEEIVFGEVSTGAQNDLHARDRHRPRDGHRVRHERGDRAGQPRRRAGATPFLETAVLPASAAPTRRKPRG